MLTWLAQLDGYRDDEISAAALIVGVVAFALVAAGGNIGGANVFVYGARVLKREDAPVGGALNPLGVEPEPAPRDLGAEGAGTAPGTRGGPPRA